MDPDKTSKKYCAAKIRKCPERGSLKAKSDSDSLVLKGEKVNPRHKMCDRLIFGSDGKVAIVELKSTVQHAPDITDKFANSAEASPDIVPKADSRASRAALALAAKRYRSFIERDAIRGERLKHDGRVYRILTGHRGSAMSEFV